MFLQNFTPPAFPGDTALAAAVAILQTASDPSGTKARLTELVEQMQAVRDAIAEHDAAKASAEAEQAKLVHLVESEKKIAADQAAVAEAHTQLAVATAAVAAREQALSKRDVEVAQREDAVAAREKSLSARRQAMITALG